MNETVREQRGPAVSKGVELIVGALPSAALVLDAEGGVIVANSIANSYGLVRSGRLAHPKLSKLLVRWSGSSKPKEGRLRLAPGPLGRPQYLTLRVSPLEDGCRLVLVDDHSEAERLASVRREFLGNVSHELKTPTFAIGLLTEAIHAAAEDPTQVRRFSEKLSEEVARLTALTHDVIELTRIQSADVLADGALVDVGKVIDEAVERNRLTAESAGVRIRWKQQVSPSVLGKHSVLVSAVSNLVLNAIQHSALGTEIEVDVGAVKDIVEISVKDFGEGIKPSEIDRIFERFYRVDEARSRETGGSGIGLAIVKHSAQSHGGEVRVRSRPGDGSTFTIRLPEAPRPAATTPAPSLREEHPA